MDKDKLKIIVSDLEMLLSALKAEVYSDVKAYTNKEDELAFSSPPTSYDEVFEDDDG